MTNAARAPHASFACPLLMEWFEPEAKQGDETVIAEAALNGLKQLHARHIPLLTLPDTTDDLAEIEAVAARIQAQSDVLVLVGIGGSSLGAEAVTALRPVTHSLVFEVMDNPDPETFAQMKSTLNPARTSWLFVSKSGGTIETVSQILIVLKWLEDTIGKQGIAERCVIVTEPKPSSLTTLATHYHIPAYAHDPELGGRWSCISNVGMLPAASCGLDIRAFRKGTQAMLHHALNAKASDNMPVQGALYGVRQEARGRNTHTIMPYIDQLEKTASWCRQLISESLGKQGKGITPLAALGTVDQHSMLQLLLDGPDNKYFTVIVTEQHGKGDIIPSDLAELCDLGYIGGKPLGNILDAFQKGTVGSMQGSKRPVRTIHMPAMDAFHLGALLMYFMLETVLIAQMIGVDAFDQPAVEDSKIRAKKVLGV
jgi:glucose-6-phosphate isomerase